MPPPPPPARNEDANDANDGGGGDDDDDDASAIVATAHLLLRGLVPAFVGFSVGSREDGGGAGGGGVRASAFQMTYKKDLPRLGRNGEDGYWR